MLFIGFQLPKTGNLLTLNYKDVYYTYIKYYELKYNYSTLQYETYIFCNDYTVK